MTATKYGSKVRPGQRVPWANLERAAFADYPAVTEGLKASGPKAGLRWKLLYIVPLGVLAALIYAAPVWGFATVAGPVALSQTSRTAEGDITVGSMFFILGFVWVLVQGSIWLAKGRPSGSSLLGSSGMALFLGALSSALTIKRGLQHSVPAWELWILPIIACTVIGGLFFVLVVRVNRTSPRVSDTPVQPTFRETQEYEDQMQESIVGVSEQNQGLIRQDLASAIDDLESRRVISPGEARDARSAPLGLLAVHMSKASSGK